MFATVLIVLLAADPTASPNTSDSAARARAQELLKEGRELFEQGEYAPALARFQSAYGIFPSPNLQFNIGQADQSLGRLVDAMVAFEKFLATATTASLDAREDARLYTNDLRTKLGQLRVDCATSDADVALDGRTVGRTPMKTPVWALPGRHQITVRREQFLPGVDDVDITAGDLHVVTVGLRRLFPLPASSDVTPAGADITSSPATIGSGAESSQSFFRRRYVLLGGGATAALAIGAIAFRLSATSRYDELLNSCAHTSEGCTESQIDSVKTKSLISNILWGLAGATAVATGLGFYLNHLEAGVSVAQRF